MGYKRARNRWFLVECFFCLVVSTPLKNISQIRLFPRSDKGVKKKYLEPPPSFWRRWYNLHLWATDFVYRVLYEGFANGLDALFGPTWCYFPNHVQKISACEIGLFPQGGWVYKTTAYSAVLLISSPWVQNIFGFPIHPHKIKRHFPKNHDPP